jgi:hypothetical protein
MTPWKSIREAAALVSDKYPNSLFFAREIATQAIKDGCGHPKRFVRGVLVDGLFRKPEFIMVPLVDGAWVDLDGARIEAGLGGYAGGKSYRDVEVHAERFLAYIEGDLLGLFGISREVVLSDEQRTEPESSLSDEQGTSLTDDERNALAYIERELTDIPDRSREDIWLCCHVRWPGLSERTVLRTLLPLARERIGQLARPGRKRKRGVRVVNSC